MCSTKLLKVCWIITFLSHGNCFTLTWNGLSISDFWSKTSDIDVDQGILNNTGVLEDATLETPNLIRKYGYPAETHLVITDDGYILQMHRIPSKNVQNNKTVLLMHGILDTSATWVLMGPKVGLGYMLADLDYDVWMGNVRGNRYSRNHTILDSEEKSFWDFSFHEMGKYDLPAMIDYIMKNKNGSDRIHYIGHSQGTTIFWVMGSERPVYLSKIKSMHALAPVAYLTEIRSPFIRTSLLLFDVLKRATSFLNIDEFMPNTKFLVDNSKRACHDKAITQDVCSNILFLIAGFNSNQLNKTMLPVILSHTPSGASTKQLIHFGQLMISGDFRKYDYGSVESNLKYYGKMEPQKYKLNKIKIPVALYYSTNDWIVALSGVDKLAEELPNIFDKYLVPQPEFNHLDFLWAVDGRTLLYKRVVENIEKVNCRQTLY